MVALTQGGIHLVGREQTTSSPSSTEGPPLCSCFLMAPSTLLVPGHCVLRGDLQFFGGWVATTGHLEPVPFAFWIQDEELTFMFLNPTSSG